MKLNSLFAALFSFILLGATAQAHQTLGPGMPQDGFQIFSTAQDTIAVVDEKLQPIANATITIGYTAGNPFNGNVLTTDASGIASAPSLWKAALPMTVQAPGFISKTIPMALPGALNIQLNHLESSQLEVAGEATSFNSLGDGYVHFGLLVAGIPRTELISFDMANIISPQQDPLSLFGKNLDLPSNITIPTQMVTYIFPIQIAKPAYRSYVRNPGQYLLSGIHGKFPLQSVLNELRSGKTILELVNEFSFVEGGNQTLNINNNLSGVNVAVNTTPYTGLIHVQAPTGFASNQVMMSLAMQEQNGLLTPTDLKRFAPGDAHDLQTGGIAPSVLSMLMVDPNAPVPATPTSLDSLAVIAGLTPQMGAHPIAPKARLVQTFTQLSFTLTPAAGVVTPQFLPLINAPTLDAQNVLHFDVPTLPAGLDAVATYVVFSEVQTFGSGVTQTTQATRLWEVWSTTWLAQIELPSVNIVRDPAKKYRWDVMFLARPSTITGSTPGPNGVDLNSISHVTRNSLVL